MTDKDSHCDCLQLRKRALHKCGMISLNFQRFLNGLKP
ncbi:hypothetical protein RintRC_2110 [Richelia intracellularis]|nr:hypothetical protein RintRC_2110 [Richelia intracellularis]